VPANAAVDTTVVNVASDTCLDNYHDQLANYNEVYGWECNQTNAQTWTFYRVGGSSQSPIFEIELTSTGFCLDNYHSTAKSGNPVDIYECNGPVAQLWQGGAGHWSVATAAAHTAWILTTATPPI
jgi:hypothetical protein